MKPGQSKCVDYSLQIHHFREGNDVRVSSFLFPHILTCFLQVYRKQLPWDKGRKMVDKPPSALRTFCRSDWKCPWEWWYCLLLFKFKLPQEAGCCHLLHLFDSLSSMCLWRYALPFTIATLWFCTQVTSSHLFPHAHQQVSHLNDWNILLSPG